MLSPPRLNSMGNSFQLHDILLQKSTEFNLSFVLTSFRTSLKTTARNSLRRSVETGGDINYLQKQKPKDSSVLQRFVNNFNIRLMAVPKLYQTVTKVVNTSFCRYWKQICGSTWIAFIIFQAAIQCDHLFRNKPLCPNSQENYRKYSTLMNYTRSSYHIVCHK